MTQTNEIDMTTTTINSLDAHGAAAAGHSSETDLFSALKNNGYQVFRKQSDFSSKEEWKSWMQVERPQEYCLGGDGGFRDNGTPRAFCLDFFVITPSGKKVRLEQKNMVKHGTTEEKVIFDLEKVRDGVYNKEDAYFVYAFTGPRSPQCNVAALFQHKAQDENLPIEVVIDPDPAFSALLSLLESIDRGEKTPYKKPTETSWLKSLFSFSR